MIPIPSQNTRSVELTRFRIALVYSCPDLLVSPGGWMRISGDRLTVYLRALAVPLSY